MSFDIPGGKAIEALRNAALQGEIQILFSDTVVDGVTTRAVLGEYSPIGALEIMLEGTDLRIAQANTNGAYVILGGGREEEASGSDDVTSIDENATPMNEKKRTNGGLLKGLLSLALASSPSLYAQDDDAIEEVFELSPFTVDSSDDRGYQATNTLSGTRLNSENRFNGASITEVTQQLLDDLAINNFEDVLNYVPNSSPATSGGVGDDPHGYNGIFGVTYKVRGFKVTGFSRDFFKTRIAPDSYNSERMSFSRGPNSVLFGIGSPAGVTNAVSSRAAFANSNRVEVRFDTWDSTRYGASFNRELIEDKLAIKVAAVINDHRNHRIPWNNKSDRYYGALTFKPFEKTTLRAHHEWGDVERINVRNWAAADAVTPWLEAGSRDIPDGANDPDFGDLLNPAGLASPADRAKLIEEYGLQISRPQAVQVVRASGLVDEPIYYNYGREFFTALNVIPGTAKTANNRVSFTDSSIVPMTANVLGSGSMLVQEFSNTSLFLEQKITDDLFIELAFNRQDTDTFPEGMTGNTDTVYKDLLPTLIPINPEAPRARVTGDENTIPNPNYGKYFTINVNPLNYDRAYDDETARAMVSYELDLRDRFDGRLGTILGRHSFAGMYEAYEESHVLDRYQLKNAMTNPGRKAGQGLVISYQNYIDPTTGQYDSEPLRGVYPKVWFDNKEDLPGPKPSGVAPYWFGTGGSRNSVIETTSEMFAMQNYFWENRIVTTFGWRSDDVDSWAMIGFHDPATVFRHNVSGLDPKNPGSWAGITQQASNGGDTSTKGIVFTPIPELGLGFFYNESDNFRPANAGSIDIFGGEVGNESGEGKDYGLKFHLMEGKVTGSLAFFETDFQNQATNGPKNGPIAPFHEHMIYSKNAIIDYYENQTPPSDLGEKYKDFGYYQHTFTATQDLAAEGWELSLTANPTPNWRVMFNMSKQENVTSNVGPKMKEWATHIRTVMTDPAQSDPHLLTLETNLVKPDNVSYYTVDDLLDRADQRVVEFSSLEGFADQRQPEESANLSTAYDFKEGGLKGFTFGGSIRWRSEAAIGYRQLPGGSGALDATRPYWNNSTEWFGAFVKYRMKLPNDMRMSLQLNIDNLLDDETPNPLVTREVNGQQGTNRWLLPEGRSFALSAKFDF